MREARPGRRWLPRLVHEEGIPYTVRDRYERLRQFFSGYFNQDWDVDGAQAWQDVLRQYLRENSRIDAEGLQEDLRAWLAEEDSKSFRIPQNFGCDYDPRSDGLTHREWVERMLDELTSVLAVKPR